ncbi:hypothetical protein BGZ98_003522, partial [Dissophora globulifera]
PTQAPLGDELHFLPLTSTQQVKPTPATSVKIQEVNHVDTFEGIVAKITERHRVLEAALEKTRQNMASVM